MVQNMTVNVSGSWVNKTRQTLIISILADVLLIVIAMFLAITNEALIDRTNLPSFLKIIYTTGIIKGFNVTLSIIFLLIFSFMFFFTVLAYGSYTELRDRIPSWGEIIIPGIVIPLIALLIMGLTAAEEGFTLAGSASSSNISNFTSAMRWTVFGVLILMEVLISWYFYATGEE